MAQNGGLVKVNNSVNMNGLDGDAVFDISSPSNGNTVVYNSTTGTWQCAAPSVLGGLATLTGFRRTAFVTTTATSAFSSHGDSATFVIGSGNAAVAATIANSQAYGINAISATTSAFVGISGQGIWYTSTSGSFPSNLNAYCSCYMNQTTSCRFWCGLFNSAGAITSVLGTNDSLAITNGDCAAFRYSTVAGDTDFMCVTNDGTTQNTVSSGVAADTKTHQFLIVFNDAVPEVLFYIDGALVATITTHLPRTGKTYYFASGISKQGANAGVTLTNYAVQSNC
jgi:hypothetical protein